VHTCFDKCPLGACDDDGFFSETPCSTLYPLPIDGQTIFCSKGQTASYCLMTRDFDYYQVSCVAGTPTVTTCVNLGCGTVDHDVASCNP
jgi:hypothetical protein